ncbi:MAG: hypothetical protein ACREBE_04970 [bacterium]
MSEFQLGRMGIVLVGLYVLLQVLTGLPEFVMRGSSAFNADPQALAVVIGVWFAGTLLAGIAPAILIWKRDALSRHWFGGEDATGASIHPRDLLRVALVLMAVAAVFEGTIGLLTAAGVWSSMDSMSEAADLKASTVQSAAKFVLGLLVFRLATPLSQRWG